MGDVRESLAAGHSTKIKMDDLRAAYEQTRYPSYVHPRTHPAHIAAIAALCGHRAPGACRARVLEIGCGSGTNLLAMAASLPEGRFVGIDFSAQDIASAQGLAAESGADNIRFQAADIRGWEPADRYDYIIAHGVFSWVSDDVKERLLSLISRSLAPGGVAAVSYAVYPGSKVDEGLRDLLIAGGPRSDGLVGRTTAAANVLGVLERAWSRSPDRAMAGFLIERSTRIRTKSPEYLALDDLGLIRDPCYLTQFVDWAWEHGLSYLGDADLPTTLPASLAPETAAEILAMGLGPLEQTQLLDYVTQRSFRTSLLIKGVAKVACALRPDAIAPLSVRTLLTRAEASGPDLRFEAGDGLSIALTGLLGSVVEQMVRRPHVFTPLNEIVSAVGAQRGEAPGADELAALYPALLDLLARRLIEVSALRSPTNEAAPAHPRLRPINRLLARDRGLVVSQSHEAVTLTAAEQALAALLDGRHTVPMLEAALRETPLAGEVGKRVAVLARLGCLE